MTYNAGIPNANDLIANSQPQIKTNFFELNSQFGVDHTPFNNSGSNGNGFHKKTTYATQVANPVTGAGVFTVFNRANILYGRGASNAAIYEILGTFLNAQNGYIQLYGNVLLQWGRATIGAAGSNVAVTFPIAFSTTAWAVVPALYGTPQNDSTRGFGATNITASGFVAQIFNGVVTGATQIGWVAVGATTS